MCLPSPGPRFPFSRQTSRPRTTFVARRTRVLSAIPLQLMALYLVNSARRPCHLHLRKSRPDPLLVSRSFPFSTRLAEALALYPCAHCRHLTLLFLSDPAEPQQSHTKDAQLDLCAFLSAASCVDLGQGSGFVFCDIVLYVVPVADLLKRWGR